VISGKHQAMISGNLKGVISGKHLVMAVISGK
jgi:hypothetical protein